MKEECAVLTLFLIGTKLAYIFICLSYPAAGKYSDPSNAGNEP